MAGDAHHSTGQQHRAGADGSTPTPVPSTGSRSGALPGELGVRAPTCGVAPGDRGVRLVGIQTWIGGVALNALSGGVAGLADGEGRRAITFTMFWLNQVGIILKGLEGIKKLESWSARCSWPAEGSWGVGDQGRRRPGAPVAPSRSGSGSGLRRFWAPSPSAAHRLQSWRLGHVEPGGPRLDL